MDDNPHRFLNVTIRGTYITRHRHRDSPKAELFIVLAGELAFFTYDDAGQIVSTVPGTRGVGIDIQRRLAHLRGLF